jgi:hypothetical protein
MTYPKIRRVNTFMSIICPVLKVTCAFIYMAHKDLFLPMLIGMIAFTVLLITWHIYLNIVQDTQAEVLSWAVGWAEVIGKENINAIRFHTIKQDRDMYKIIKKCQRTSTQPIDVLYPDIVAEALARR